MYVWFFKVSSFPRKYYMISQPFIDVTNSYVFLLFALLDTIKKDLKMLPHANTVRITRMLRNTLSLHTTTPNA
jgi:hypothetical protein